jgi:hypothetical protein
MYGKPHALYCFTPQCKHCQDHEKCYFWHIWSVLLHSSSVSLKPKCNCNVSDENRLASKCIKEVQKHAKHLWERQDGEVEEDEEEEEEEEEEESDDDEVSIELLSFS